MSILRDLFGGSRSLRALVLVSAAITAAAMAATSLLDKVA